MILKWNYRGSEAVFLSSQVRASQSKKNKKIKKWPQVKDKDKGTRLRYNAESSERFKGMFKDFKK